MKRIEIALVGERSDVIVAHRGIPLALAMAAEVLQVDVVGTWVRTDAEADLARFQGVWCVPGSPYASMDGALAAIRHARERRVPFLGTCGGFQHAVIEYARNVKGFVGAEHAESAHDAALAIMVPLECALVEMTKRVRLASGSRLAEAYGALETTEEYQCRFGLDEAWRGRLEDDALVFTGFDEKGDVRGVELRSHPFFVGTLFQPERSALRGVEPRLVTAFVARAANSDPALTVLRDAVARQDKDDLARAMLLVDPRETPDENLAPVLAHALEEPWHDLHEDIARMLQLYRDPRTVPALARAARSKHPYLASDDSHALARKCIWALAHVGTPEAQDRLRELAQDRDPEVAGYARRRLSRWDEERGRKGA